MWEALFLEMIQMFITANPKHSNLLHSISEAFDTALNRDAKSHEHLFTIQEIVSQANGLDDFTGYITKMGEADDTWKMWSNFVFLDCFSYASLFLSIRTSEWDLRMSSLKNMAPLFSAYDRPYYQKIIPSHIADLVC